VARILVTGGSGFIGSHLVKLLVERGDDVAVLARRGSKLEPLEGEEVRVLRGDASDREAVRRAMSGIERVFHAAGTTNLAMPRERIFELNVATTRTVLEEALRAGVERAVYTSSVAAIGPAAPGSVADERNEASGTATSSIAYVDSKREAEFQALRLVDRGLPLVIVNPTYVLGAGDPGRSSTAMVRRFLLRQIPAYVDGTLNVVGVDDVARGHLLAEQYGEVGERYILGNRNFTLDRLFADLGRLSGVEPPAVKLPLAVALSLSAAGRRIGGTTLPSADEIRASSLNWAFSNKKAKRELGWSTSPHEDALEQTIAWYREREGSRLAQPGARQPLAVRVAGSVLRRIF
jgi:dihydroflavonol-4-reductase